MNARELIAALGGVPKLVKLTGLPEGRIYQWQTGNYIPRAWLKFFRARYPRKVAWDELVLADHPPRKVGSVLKTDPESQSSRDEDRERKK